MDRETSGSIQAEAKAFRLQFGQRLTRLRELAGLSIASLADAAELPVELLENVEAGRCSIAVEHAYDVAARIGLHFLFDVGN